MKQTAWVATTVKKHVPAELKRKVDILRAINEGLGVSFAIDRQTWRKWERGLVTPNKRTLARLAEVYPAGDWRREMAGELMGETQC